MRTKKLKAPSIQAGPEHQLSVIDQFASELSACTGLSMHDAKTVAYWAVQTHGMNELLKTPGLVVLGPSSTGKTTTMNALIEVVLNPDKASGENSDATARDEFKEGGTAIVEEADDIDEKLVRDRYDRGQAIRSVKRAGSRGKWTQDKFSIFGPTAMHRRVSFKDHAVNARVITVRTRPKGMVKPYDPGVFQGLRDAVVGLAHDVDWPKVSASTGIRSGDTWAPLLAVAEAVRDEEWLVYSNTQIVKAESALAEGQAEEHEPRVLDAVVALATRSGQSGPPRETVSLKEVTETFNGSERDLSSRQVGDIVRDELGLSTEKKGGVIRILTGGRGGLQGAAERIEAEDLWLDDDQDKDDVS